MENKELTLNEYQQKAMTTCMPSSCNVAYMLLNLQGEVGEFSSKLAKHIRKGEATVVANHLQWNKFTLSEEQIKEYENLLKAEAGDIMWQTAGLCEVMGWTLEEVCKANLDKLASRKQRGVIDGNGDNR